MEQFDRTADRLVALLALRLAWRPQPAVLAQLLGAGCCPLRLAADGGRGLAGWTGAGPQLASLLEEVSADGMVVPSLTPGHWDLAWQQAAAVRAMGLSVTTPDQWVPLLRQVRPVSPVLFVRGAASLLGRAGGVAVVGARAASAAGERWAYERAYEAASAGELVVSGGARGIDGAAHRGALDAGGVTLAYLGVAADRIYPARHRPLFARMLRQGGALVSEFAPGEGVGPWGHARRNRLIAGHAQQVLIAEAQVGSGSLGTAEAARRLGVPVWVAPATVGGARSGLEALVGAGEARVWVDPKG